MIETCKDNNQRYKTVFEQPAQVEERLVRLLKKENAMHPTARWLVLTTLGAALGAGGLIAYLAGYANTEVVNFLLIAAILIVLMALFVD